MYAGPERPTVFPFQKKAWRVEEYEKNREKALRTNERLSKRRARLPVKLAATALTLSSIVSAYWQDVEQGRMAESQASVSVSDTLAPQQEANSNRATLVIDGFNAKDATYLSGTLGPAIQEIGDGTILSLNYNNALLDREEVFDKAVSYAHEHNITTLSVVGYSMGGIIGTELTADLNSKSNITVENLATIETPYGYDGLREYQKNELAFGQWVATNIPGSEYSSWMRKAGEVYFYRNAYTHDSPLENVGNFLRITGEVLSRQDTSRLTSTRLLMQQIYKISHVDFAKEFETIKTQHGNKAETVISYFKTSGYDDVVDDSYSGFHTCADASDYKLSCNVFTVDGAQHSLYFNSIPAFETAFKEADELIGPLVKENATIAALQRQYLASRAIRLSIPY